jgi:asparagine synthase (glutamine-hydrolysing)
MCAIAGLICLSRRCKAEDHVRIVRMMCDIQNHRGPDDSGVISLEHVCLGSNRLSIIDLSQAGHMPMSDAEKSFWIVYNGETYNFQSLREELIHCGHEFRSKTDTEVVLHAFKQWGEQCFGRFAGMFAFAIYDRQNDALTLVRDRFGKKPLYYTHDIKHIVFASEMKVLLRVSDAPKVNRQRLMEWSLYRNVDFGSPSTLVENIFSLPAGHFIQIHDGRIGEPQRYYSVESEVDAVTYRGLEQRPQKEVVTEIESLLVKGVQERLVSDVPLGVLCSGGVDSSLVTALCAHYRKDVAAFHVSVAGHPEMDESRYARQVAQTMGIDLFTCALERDNFCANLARAVYYSDVPLTHPNSVAYLLVSELARKQGTIVLMSGEAADELFGGYMHRYRRYRQLQKARRLLGYLPAKMRQIINLAGHACNGVQATELPGYGNGLAQTIAMLDGFGRSELRLRCTEAYRFVSNDGDRAVLAAMLADLTNFLSPLLRRLDRMSMAASVECRVPFLDHRLVKKIINLPLSYRLQGRTDKWLLKEIAAHYLPRTIVYRKKLGFPLPLHDYLEPLAREELFHKGFCLEYLRMQRKGLMDSISKWRDDSEGFFTLLTLEIWGRLFFFRQPLEEVTEKVTQLSAHTRSLPGMSFREHGVLSRGTARSDHNLKVGDSRSLLKTNRRVVKRR